MLNALPTEGWEESPRPPASTLSKETHAPAKGRTNEGSTGAGTQEACSCLGSPAPAGSCPAHRRVSGFPTSFATTGFSTAHLAASGSAAAAWRSAFRSSCAGVSSVTATCCRAAQPSARSDWCTCAVASRKCIAGPCGSAGRKCFGRKHFLARVGFPLGTEFSAAPPGDWRTRCEPVRPATGPRVLQTDTEQ